LLTRCDLLFCAHVFEHIPEPYELLSRLAAPMLPWTLLYIELPINYEGSLPSCFKAVKETLSRGEPMPWHPFVTLHEHVNHYSKKSVSTLASRAGFSPLEFYMTDLDIMGMLARKREL
jgi:trans-aconitate methyltransferase